MPLQMSSEKLLSFMCMPEYTRLFGVGLTGKSVTFSDQQVRAFNLAWAMRSASIPLDSVAIVGGGISGLTIAAGIAMTGDTAVTLFEQCPCLLHLQQNNRTRYVHPHLHRWPRKDWDWSSTSLPDLNWSSGSPESISSQILARWSNIQKRCNIRTLTSTTVTDLDEGVDSISLTAKHRSGEEMSGRFDAVILATGFGVEHSRIPFVQATSYWDNDNFDQPVKQRVPRRFFVSGNGDGGLIDTLRLRLNRVWESSELIAHLHRISEFELEAYHAIESECERLRGTLAPAEVSCWLSEQYDSLQSPAGWEDFVAGRLRPDTIVILNGNSPTYFNCYSSALNRFLLNQLRRVDATLRYVQKAIVAEDVLSTPQGHEIHVSPSERIIVDELVMRQGAIDRLTQVLPRLASSISRISAECVEVTRTPQWPQDFFPRRSLERHAFYANSVSESECKTLRDSLKGLRILVVDDDRQFRSSLCQLLTFAGAFVKDTGSISESMTVIEEATVNLDMVIVDYYLPDGSLYFDSQFGGAGLLRHIRLRFPGIRLFGMTGVMDVDSAHLHVTEVQAVLSKNHALSESAEGFVLEQLLRYIR